MSTLRTDSTSARPRLGGLDGLRAIAVSLVVVYHFFPNALPGGFLGVDVFFVISGFLITTLLLDEHRRHGRLALGDFWRRRARRLLPALALVLLVCTSAALALGGDLLINIGAQLAGAALFVANWVYIALGADYFAQDNPEIFRNTWSLAIEEQFYLFLPLVLLIALRMRSRWSRALLFATLGIASAASMSGHFLAGESATRVYFGTDTHVFGLLLGVALACAMGSRKDRSARTVGGAVAPMLQVWQQMALLCMGALGLTTLGWLTFTLAEGSPESFIWGFQLATLSVLVVVWAATREGAWLGRALDVQPLRWVGERSYGIYLWHWPLLLLVTEWSHRVETAEWVSPTLTLALTLLFASFSYRFIEQPVRRQGLRRALSVATHLPRLRGAQLAVGVTVLAILVTTVPATSVAIATAPQQSTGSDVISRGQAALDAQPQPIVQRPTTASGDGGAATPGAEMAPGSLGPEGFTADWAKSLDYEAPPPTPIEGWQVFAVGDSVMLASAPELAAAFPSIWIDADVSRGLGTGVGILENLAARGELREVLVVGLGTNGPIDNADLETLLRVADGRRIVLVNAHADRWWIPEVNAQLRAFADKHRGVTLAEWDETIVGVPGGLAGDDIHPNPSGGEAYAQAVQRAFDALLERDEQPTSRLVRR